MLSERKGSLLPDEIKALTFLLIMLGKTSSGKEKENRGIQFIGD